MFLIPKLVFEMDRYLDELYTYGLQGHNNSKESILK